MPRGMFTQCFTVLLKEPISLDIVAARLTDFSIHGAYEAADHWAMHGPAVSLPFRPEVNGLVLVDIVDQPWPDDMGDPQNETPVSAAWMTGQFGPLTSPGSLQRAMNQCWGWKEGRTAPAQHRGFIRARSSYVLGAGEGAELLPKDWDAAAELLYLTNVVEALLTLPNALCYFNPSGEILRDLASLRTQMLQAKGEGTLPIDLWCNVRLYNYDAEWVLMDTVGNGQLNSTSTENPLSELRDIEALYRTKEYHFNDVDHFLRDVTLYLHAEGDVIKDGDTIDGPGNIPWLATFVDKSVAMPPRPIIRLAPVDGVEPPAKPL